MIRATVRVSGRTITELEQLAERDALQFADGRNHTVIWPTGPIESELIEIDGKDEPDLYFFVDVIVQVDGAKA